MVTTPGKASRVLTMPEAAPPALQAQATPPAADGTQTPANAAQSGNAAPANAAPETASVRVTAVEFDGSKIYIAGSAPAGTTIRALVDDTRVGESKAEASGSFVVEGDIQLSVGSHIITAEALDASGKVTVRVRVPFSRPETDQATVAMQPSGAPAAQQNATASGKAPAAVTDQAAFEALRTEVSKALVSCPVSLRTARHRRWTRLRQQSLQRLSRFVRFRSSEPRLLPIRPLPHSLLASLTRRVPYSRSLKRCQAMSRLSVRPFQA